MAITVYGIANCDTIKKTKKLLDSLKLEYAFVDFKKLPPKPEQINRWLERFGAEQVINKKGTTWRKLDDQDKQRADGNIEQQIALLQQNPSMIKRPIIEAGKQFIIGFDEKAIEKLT